MSLTSLAMLEAPDPNTLMVEDAAIPRGFVQLPKVVLYARHLSRDAKLLYAVLVISGSALIWMPARMPCAPGCGNWKPLI